MIVVLVFYQLIVANVYKSLQWSISAMDSQILFNAD